MKTIINDNDFKNVDILSQFYITKHFQILPFG